ncbi:unnamed protein product [Clonostachys rosea f. rosea IK726]|uniref:Uncharacterized protein n=1 Tax=Clonostachys rosea f. rosea IK726 TaxID=1349383 RepID=A0ACA9T799_BIOOC|nr:unnamed protein product [Clonostachys rosea f. rosea IK726]
MAGFRCAAWHGAQPTEPGNPTPGCCWLAAHETRCDRRYASAEDLVSGAWTHVGETPALWRADSVGGKQPADHQTEAIAVMMEMAGHASGRQLPSCSSLVASPLTASRSSGTWQNGTVLE